MLSKIKKGIALVFLATSLFAFVTSPLFGALQLAFRFYDPFSISEYRLKHLSTEAYVAAINSSLQEADVDEAQNLVILATEYGHKIPDDLIARTQRSTLDTVWRYSTEFYSGMANGEVSSTASMGGSMMADAFNFGDLRDIVLEGEKIVRGEDYDKLTLGMASIGMLTIAPIPSPLDAGASIIKTANKAKKLSKPLTESLLKLCARLVDIPRLKNALTDFSLPVLRAPKLSTLKSGLQSLSFQDLNNRDFSKVKDLGREIFPIVVGAVRKRFSGIVRKAPAEELSIFTKSTGSIFADADMKATMRSLEYAENSKELSKFSSLAKPYGKKTSSVLRALGKKAILIGELIYQIIASIFFAIAWLGDMDGRSVYLEN